MPVSTEVPLNPKKMRAKIIELAEHINALEKLRATVTMPGGTATGTIEIQGGSSSLNMSAGKEIGN